MMLLLFNPSLTFSHFFYCFCISIEIHLSGCLQVLATGLSGLYSSLPARLQVYSEDWHCLDEADWQQVTSTLTEHQSLELVLCANTNTLINTVHEELKRILETTFTFVFKSSGSSSGPLLALP